MRHFSLGRALRQSVCTCAGDAMVVIISMLASAMGRRMRIVWATKAIMIASIAAAGLVAGAGAAFAARCSVEQKEMGCKNQGRRLTQLRCDCSEVVGAARDGTPVTPDAAAETPISRGPDIGMPMPSAIESTPLIRNSPFAWPSKPAAPAALPPPSPWETQTTPAPEQRFH